MRSKIFSSLCTNYVGLQPIKRTLQVFELKMWSSNQNSSILLGKFIGAQQKCGCPLARALKNEIFIKSMKNTIFMICLFWRALLMQKNVFTWSRKVFWLLDCYSSSNIGENRFSWSLLNFENFQNSKKFNFLQQKFDLE